MAVIGAPHGIKGELRVKTFTGDPLALGDYGPLFAKNGRSFEIVDIRPANTVVVVRFKGVKDRKQAEALTGTELFIDRSALPDEGEDGEFYHADLIGLAVKDETGASVGKVTAVQNFGGGDILELALGGRKGVLIPFTQAAVPEVDIAAGFVRIDTIAAGLVEDEATDESRPGGAASIRKPPARTKGCRRQPVSFRATVLTLYPEMFPGALGLSLAGRALEAGTWSLETVQIRDFAADRHRTVDDTPAGGGAGMVMRADVLAKAIDHASPEGDPRPRLLMSPRGKPLTQARVRELAAGPGAVIVCGRFEGVDQRVIDARGLEEVSIGDFILSGGEPAALVLLDAVVRLLPGVMGNEISGDDESFENGLLEHPHYTRPQVFEGRAIPDVLSPATTRKSPNGGATGRKADRRARPDLLPRRPAFGCAYAQALERQKIPAQGVTSPRFCVYRPARTGRTIFRTRQ